MCCSMAEPWVLNILFSRSFTAYRHPEDAGRRAPCRYSTAGFVNFQGSVSFSLFIRAL